MAQGYATIANGGYAIKPYVIDAIFGPDGELLYRAEPLIVCAQCETEAEPGYDRELVEEIPPEQLVEVALDYRPDASTAPELFAGIKAAPRAITAQNAYLIQDMMRDVIRRGTGRRAMVLGRRDLSGKTGTSNDRRDAWFGGFNADLASVVWVGYDDDLPLGPGEEGSRTALPIWIEFSRLAFAGVREHQMPMPEGIVSVKIDRTTGCPARAGQLNTTFEVFREGHVPSCDNIQDLPDIFNDPTGIDATADAPEQGGPTDDETVDEETLF